VFFDPGASLKALRPLRGRAPPEPWPRRLSRRVRRGRRQPKSEVTTALTRPRSFRDDLRVWRGWGYAIAVETNTIAIEQRWCQSGQSW